MKRRTLKWMLILATSTTWGLVDGVRHAPMSWSCFLAGVAIGGLVFHPFWRSEADETPEHAEA